MYESSLPRRPKYLTPAALVIASLLAHGCLEVDLSEPEALDELDVKAPATGDDEEVVDKSTMLTNGTPVEGVINFSGDYDWHSFYIDRTSSCVIETVLDGTLYDSFMELYGPNSSSTLITYDDDSGPGWASRISRTLGAATYYVKVRGFSSYTGSYHVKTTCSCIRRTCGDECGTLADGCGGYINCSCVCGDGKCQSNETPTNCAEDCCATLQAGADDGYAPTYCPQP